MANLAQSIDSFLRARHSPLAGYGQALVNAAITAGHRYKVDPGYLAKLIVGISGGEQSYGTSGAPDVALRNLWGWGHPPDASHGMGFSSYPQAVQTLAEGLAKGYLSQGLVSPEQIAPKYVGVGDHTGWINTVRSTISQLGGPVPSSAAVPASAVSPGARVLPGTRAQAPQNPGQALALSLINQNNRMVGLPGLPTNLLGTLTAPTPAGPKQIPVVKDSTIPVSPQASSVVKLAQKYLGTPYVWGGESPKGFDCSGFLQYVWNLKGVHIPRVSQDQWNAGRPVAKNQLQPGDAVFFHMGSQGPGHVGMYIGNDQFIAAPHSGDVVKISRLSTYGGYAGARRFT